MDCPDIDSNLMFPENGFSLLQLFFLNKLSLILKSLSFDITHEIIAKWEGLKVGLTILDRLKKLESLPY